jgi:hypothetical protein
VWKINELNATKRQEVPQQPCVKESKSKENFYPRTGHESPERE